MTIVDPPRSPLRGTMAGQGLSRPRSGTAIDGHHVAKSAPGLMAGGAAGGERRPRADWQRAAREEFAGPDGGVKRGQYG